MPTGDDSPWASPRTVAGFASASPNEVLLAFARRELRRAPAGRLLDIGCGAGRNAVPLAALGWNVLGLDLVFAMLMAAARRAEEEAGRRLPLAQAVMDELPVPSRSCDVLVAHGIWNLARSSAEMRRGMAEAARVAAPGAGLFVFTFARETLPAGAVPVAGERFVFTDFSGAPQCFLTADELVAELAAVGFTPEPTVPLRELNRPAPGQLQRGGPVILEAGFRRMA